MSKPKYIHLTQEDTHKEEYKDLRPIKLLQRSNVAYVQLFDKSKTAVYLLNERTQELKPLWVGLDYDNDKVYLLPYQVRNRGKADPCYYFKCSYWGRDKLIDWLKSFNLKIYYASGVGTGYYMVDDYLNPDA